MKESVPVSPTNSAQESEDRPTAPAPVGYRAWAALLVLYAVTRLVRLTALPAFLDESWHASWAMHIADGQRWDRPWQFGKGLSVFVNSLAFPWAAGHWLWASRFVTVLLSVVGLWGCVETARRLFGRSAGLVGGIIYCLCPFLLFHERLVLADPVMAAFGAALLALSVRMAQSPTVGAGLAAGLALTLVLLSKVTGLALAFEPLATVILLRARPWRAWRGLLAAYAVPAIVMGWPLWHFFRTSPTMRVGVGAGGLASRLRFGENLPLAADWLGGYLTRPLLLLAGAGLALAVVRRDRGGWLLGLVAVLPLIVFVAVGQIWFPRYVVFTAAPLVVLAASAVVAGAEAARRRHGPVVGRAVLLGGLAFGLAAALPFDYALWTDPTRAPLPATDRFQFVDGWPSGYGIRDTISFLKGELERQPQGLTLVYHSRSQRTLSFAASVAFHENPRVHVQDLLLDEPKAIPALEALVAQGPTVVVLSSPRETWARPDPRPWLHLGSLAAVTHKPDGRVCDRIYRLCGRPDCGS